MSKYTLGSLFDGSGGFPLAGSLCGIEPKWASEVEPYPIAVTCSRFPNMEHLGDISKINGAEIEPVDIASFGSPCQDLSVAGLRKGLRHEANGDEETTRSGLFMEAVRIIKEMRGATNGKYPRFALWENVPGAFSSNKGEDFRVVLEELIKIVEPTASMPSVPQNGWPYADCYRGDGWSIAYRVLDAQYWGVPQRRRRIYLVADFGGERAHKVLFEREGLRGYFAEGRAPWQAAAVDAEISACAANPTERGRVPCGVLYNQQCPVTDAGADDRAGNCVAYGWPLGFRPENVRVYEETATTICNGTRPGFTTGVIQLIPLDNVASTLRAGAGAPKHEQDFVDRLVLQPVCSKTWDARGNGDGNTVSTLTGDGNTVSTLTGDHENRITDYTSVVVEETPVFCLQGSMIGRTDKNGPQGDGVNEGVSFTCNTTDRHAVAYEVYRQGGFADYVEGEVGTLQAAGGDYGGGTENLLVQRDIRYIVRRLTPTECARLQGFPGEWGHVTPKSDFSDAEYSFWQEVRNTHAAINGKAEKEYSKEQMLTWYNKLHTDSSEYKMWGNGIALPTALYVMQGIADALKGEGKVNGLIGYSGIGSEGGKFVAAEDAREHVLKECGLAMQESTYLSDEAMDALVEWYFSGEWLEVREDE